MVTVTVVTKKITFSPEQAQFPNNLHRWVSCQLFPRFQVPEHNKVVVLEKSGLKIGLNIDA